MEISPYVALPTSRPPFSQSKPLTLLIFTMMPYSKPLRGGYSTMSMAEASAAVDSSLRDAYVCGVCHELCSFPVLFQCTEHYFCAKCIRSWVAATRTYDRDAGTYIFEASCPICRVVVSNCEDSLVAVPARVMTSLHSKRALPCPFCDLKHADKHHVATCQHWRVKCEHCLLLVPYNSLEQHNIKCAWICPHSECIDGYHLAPQQQLQHLQQHLALQEQATRLRIASGYTYATSRERAAAMALMQAAADTLDDLYKETHRVDDDSDDMMAAPSETTFRLVDLINTVEQMKEIEDMLLRHNIPEVSKRHALRRQWRLLSDQLPKLSLAQWIEINGWDLLPWHVRYRLSNPVVEPAL